jgi:hypothetical protein
MAKYISDIINKLYEDVDNFAGIDSTALDALILEYLETPQNGYMTEESTYWDDDTTSFITILIDSTAPSISELEWKEQYLEQTYNQMFLQNGQSALRDSSSPHYPLVDFKGQLIDFDADTSLDYYIAKDSTTDVFIEEEFPSAQKIDGMYLQLGNNGCDSTSNINFLSYYIAFSNDKINWQYITNHEPIDTTSEVIAIITSDVYEAIDNCFSITQLCPIADQTVDELIFTDTAIEAKYWRIHFVDLYPVLVRLTGPDPGYTGYTASVSHLRFQQIREHGNILFDKSTPTIKTKGSYSSGLTASGYGNSGASWFTTLEMTSTFIGTKQTTVNIFARCWTDGSVNFRIRTNNNDEGWVQRDLIAFSSGYVTLMYIGDFVNPNTDLSLPWSVKVDLQDYSVGTPAITYRLALSGQFRSSTED